MEHSTAFPNTTDLTSFNMSHGHKHEVLRPALFVTLICFLDIIAIISNAIIVLAYYKITRIRTVRNSYIVSLAVCDLFIATVSVPFYLPTLILKEWPYGRVFCVIWVSIDNVASLTSVFMIVCISYDWYSLVRHSARYYSRKSLKRPAWRIFYCWLAAFMMRVPFTIFGEIWVAKHSNWNKVSCDTESSFDVPYTIGFPIYETTYTCITILAELLIPLCLFTYWNYKVFEYIKKKLLTPQGDKLITSSLKIERASALEAAALEEDAKTQQSTTEHNENEDVCEPLATSPEQQNSFHVQKTPSTDIENTPAKLAKISMEGCPDGIEKNGVLNHHISESKTVPSKDENNSGGNAPCTVAKSRVPALIVTEPSSQGEVTGDSQTQEELSENCDMSKEMQGDQPGESKATGDVQCNSGMTESQGKTIIQADSHTTEETHLLSDKKIEDVTKDTCNSADDAMTPAKETSKSQPQLQSESEKEPVADSSFPSGAYDNCLTVDDEEAETSLSNITNITILATNHTSQPEEAKQTEKGLSEVKSGQDIRNNHHQIPQQPRQRVSVRKTQPPVFQRTDSFIVCRWLCLPCIHRNGHDASSCIMLNKKRKAALLVTLYSVLFVLFKLPYSILVIFSQFCEGSSCAGDEVYEAMSWFYWTKSLVNPFLYAYISHDFRKYAHKLYESMPRCCNQS